MEGRRVQLEKAERVVGTGRIERLYVSSSCMFVLVVQSTLGVRSVCTTVFGVQWEVMGEAATLSNDRSTGGASVAPKHGTTVC